MSPQVFFHINANSLVAGRNNSVYELAVHQSLLYIPDYRNNKIIVVDASNGRWVRNMTVPTPHGITVGSDGTIFAACYKQNVVHAGVNDLSEIKNSAFDWPVSLALSGDKVYLANWGSGAAGNIVVADVNFKTTEQFGAPRQRFRPHCIRVFDGEIYVVNRDPASVIMFNRQGSVLQEQVLPSDFNPTTITQVDDRFLVGNYADGKIHIFDRSFKNLGSFEAGHNFPMSTAVYGEKLFVSEEAGNRIQVLALAELECLVGANRTCPIK